MEIELSNANRRQRPPSSEYLGVLSKRLAMLSELYRTQLTELQVLGYTESLVDVKPKFLDMGFALAFKKYKFIPTPAEIIEQSEIAAERDAINRESETYPPVTQEDRDAGLEFSAKLKELLDRKDEPSPQPAVEFESTGSVRSEELLQKYREWLAEASKSDKLDRANGLSPVPRYEAERLAMYMALPVEARRKLARSGEWTKLNTKNI